MVKNYIIGGLLIFILFLSLCSPKKKNSIKENSIYYIKTDTFIKNIHVPIEKVKYIREEKAKIQPKTILSDSNNTKQYLSTFYYMKKDSLLNGSILIDAYSRPERVQFEYDFKQMTIKDSVYIEKIINKNKLFIGGSVVVNPMMSNLYLGLSYYHKKGHLFSGSIGYDLTNNHKLISIGYKKEL